MSGTEPQTSEINVQQSQMPVKTLPGAAAGAGKANGLFENIMAANKKIEFNLQPESSESVQLMEQKENAPPEEPPPPVLYKVQYLNNEMDVIFSKENKEPIVVQNTLSAFGEAVIEVITDVQVAGSYKLSDEKKEEPRTAFSMLGTKLKINSPAIITALQSVIEYYPGHSFSDVSNTIEEPYAAFIHHEEELKAYRDRFNPDVINSKDELCQRNANTYEHLGILQNVLSERSSKTVEAERQRHARGVATFEMLWLLLRPGTDVYCDTYSDGNYDAYVIRSVSGGMFRGRPTPLKIEMWHMGYDGEKFGRKRIHTSQPVYDGEKETASLVVFPCKFLKEEPKEKEKTQPLREKLEKRGKTFFKLAQRQCMDYDGTTQSWPKKHVSIS